MNYHTMMRTGNKLDDQAIAGEGTFTIWYMEPEASRVKSVTVSGIRTARVTYDALVKDGYMMHNTRP